jgi:hypothetical protein
MVDPIFPGDHKPIHVLGKLLNLRREGRKVKRILIKNEGFAPSCPVLREGSNGFDKGLVGPLVGVPQKKRFPPIPSP